ncbi:MAG TPA: serine hydrolase domain-containing protein [Candidatus Acidoferrum sp.]
MRATWPFLFVLTFALAIGNICPCAAQEDQRQLRKIDAIVSAVSKPNDPGFAVLVKKGPVIFFQKGYGVRELGKPGKIDPTSNFRLASVTKQFTAMAIMLLIHDRQLRYEDRLTDIWPDFPVYGREITVRHLLNHTSGIRDYSELMEVEEKARGPRWTPDRQISDEEVLQLLKAQTSGEFTPGMKWQYSNSGYVVLGSIVAKVSGMPYEDFLRKRIFVPLKMKNSVVYVTGKNAVKNRAFGHSKEGDLFKKTDQSATSATLGDGGIYSSVADLAKWDQGLINHTLLNEQEILPAWTPAKMADGSPYFWPRAEKEDQQTPPESVAYGFGWFLDSYKGHDRQAHDGGTMGFRTTIQRYVNDKLTIIILSNRTDVSPHELGEKIADVMLRDPKQ